MAEATFAKPETVPPEAQLAEMMMTQLVSRLVHLTATLKLPDYLADGPKTAQELAPLTATHAPSLHRVLRTLSSLGVFTEDGAQRFSLQPLGAALKSGTPSHAAALILGGELICRSLDHFLHSVRTGETGFEKAFGVPVFDWLAAHPAEASLFNDTMVGFHGMSLPRSPRPTTSRISRRLPTLADRPGIC